MSAFDLSAEQVELLLRILRDHSAAILRADADAVAHAETAWPEGVPPAIQEVLDRAESEGRRQSDEVWQLRRAIIRQVEDKRGELGMYLATITAAAITPPGPRRATSGR